MKLDEDERMELAAKLMDTVDPETEERYAGAWAAEIGERERQLDSGEVQAIPWDEARKTIRSRGDVDETS